MSATLFCNSIRLFQETPRTRCSNSLRWEDAMASGSSLYHPTENTCCLSLKVASWPVWALLVDTSIRTFLLICMILTYLLIILTLASEYM
jgi:hypothetical protein